MLNLFTLASNDQSVYYLGEIFGNMGIALAGTGSTLLPSMFKVFNSALLVVGTLMVAYITVMGVVHTAAEGEFLGKKWGNVWLPLRMLAGVAALFPTGTGYCASQVVIMWFIVQGVGAADMVWKAAVDYLVASGGALSSAGPDSSALDVTGSLPTMLQQIYGNTACQASIVKTMGGFTFNGVPTGDPNLVARTAPMNPVSKKYSFGRAGTEYTKSECGTLTLKGTGKAGSIEAQQQATDTIIPVLDILANYYVNLIIKDPNCWSSGSGGDNDQVVGKACNPKQTDASKTDFCNYFRRYNTMAASCPYTAAADSSKIVDDMINQAGSNFMMDAAKLYYGYAQNYATQQTLKDAQQGGTSPNVKATAQLGLAGMIAQAAANAKNDAYKAARVNGWIFAGAYYYFIAQQSNQPSDFFVEFVSPAALEKTAPQFNNTYNTDFVKYLSFPSNATTGAVTLARALSKSASDAAAAGGGLKVKAAGAGLPNSADAAIGPLAAAAANIAGSFIDSLTPAAGRDPIVRIHDFGHQLLLDADIIFITFLVVGIVLGVAATYQIFFGSNLNVVAGIAQFLQSYIIPLVYFFVGYLITVGGLLGVYLPMLPFMLFTFGAIGWFIGVSEAMVAGPIVALGMLFAGGESELLGKASHAAMNTLNLFLRPTLMVFGMMTAMLMGYVVIQFINTTFYTVMSNMGGLGIIEAFMFMMVYASLVITALNKCYSLIYHFPDRAPSWIGIQSHGYGEEQSAQGAKDKVAAAGAAGLKAQQGLPSGMASASFKGAKAAMKAKAEDDKKAAAAARSAKANT